MPLGTKPYRRTSPDRFRRISRKVSPMAALLYAHLAMGRPSSPIGLVEVDIDMLRVDLRGADPMPLLRELAETGAIVLDGEWLYLAGYEVDDPPANPSVKQGRLAEARLAVGAAREACIAEIEHGVETVSTRCRDGVGMVSTSEQEQEQEQEQEREQPTPRPSVSAPKGAKTARVVKPKAPNLADNPPTLADTIAVLTSEGCPSGDADRIARACLGYWESAGWKRKTGPILSWPGTVRTWLANQCERDATLSRRVDRNRHPTTPSAPVVAQDATTEDMPAWYSEWLANGCKHNERTRAMMEDA